MFKVALIQNTSELRNYSYADLRKDLQKLKFEIIDITRDNVDTLTSVLDESTDCVLFASNSLNDNKIYQYVCGEEFTKAFNEYLDNGGASLVMHQNSLKETPNPLPFLNCGIDKLEANNGGKNVTLKKSEKSAEQYFVFPNKVSEKQIAEYCFKNPALHGNYWMLLKSSTNEWSPILVDNFGNSVIQKHSTKKVVFSSVLLDYQKHSDFLQNILINLIVDNMSLAILENGTPDTLGFSYFLNSLQNNKLYFKRYSNSKENLDDLLNNIRLGIHSAILISDMTEENLPQEILSSIDQYGVKLIQIDGKDVSNSDSFVVHSVDKSISLLFSKIELKIQQDLSSGFVSGSFMKTIEVLAKLKEFEKNGMTKGTYDKETLAHVLEKVSPHINENGSYDNTFGATCRVLWLFYTFLGKNDKLTNSSYDYIKNCNNIESLKEKLDRFYILSFFEENPKEYLTENCSPIIQEVINSDFSYVTEYDFLTVLKVALAIKNPNVLWELFRFIKSHTEENGEFFNSYVTACSLSYMIDMYNAITDTAQKEKIRELLFEIIIYLRNVNTDVLSIEETLQVVCALYKFESVVSFPVNDLTELIFKTGTFPHDYHAFETHINNYQKSRIEMDSIVKDNESIKKENRNLKIYRKAFFGILLALTVTLYLSIYLLVVLGDYNSSVFKAIFDKIWESWPSLFALIIVPVATFIFNRYLKKRDDK